MKKYIPNLLSVIRLLCIPFFVWQFTSGNRFAAAGIFCFASATDVLDGYLARRNKWITTVEQKVNADFPRPTVWAHWLLQANCALF